jgi:hypothetical protein
MPLVGFLISVKTTKENREADHSYFYRVFLQARYMHKRFTQSIFLLT